MGLWIPIGNHVVASIIQERIDINQLLFSGKFRMSKNAVYNSDLSASIASEYKDCADKRLIMLELTRLIVVVNTFA